MTPEEITAIAKEAGFPFNKYGLLQGDDDGEIDADAAFAIFAALVAAKEREACAQVCDAERQDFGGVAAGPMTTDAGKRVHEAMAAGAATCAAAIRARGTKEGV